MNAAMTLCSFMSPPPARDEPMDTHVMERSPDYTHGPEPRMSHQTPGPEPRMSHQIPGPEPMGQALPGTGVVYHQMTPPSPNQDEMTSAYAFINKVRTYLPALSDYLMIFMSLTLQVCNDPLINAFLESNPSIAQAMVLNPNLGSLLRWNLDLVHWVKNDLIFNVACKVNPWLAEMLLLDPQLSDVCQRNWIRSIQMPQNQLPSVNDPSCVFSFNLPEFTDYELNQILQSQGSNLGSSIDQLIASLEC